MSTADSPATIPADTAAAYPRHTIMVPCILGSGGRYAKIEDAHHEHRRWVVVKTSEVYVDCRLGVNYVKLMAVDEIDGLHHVELPGGEVLWVNTAAGVTERKKYTPRTRQPARGKTAPNPVPAAA